MDLKNAITIIRIPKKKYIGLIILNQVDLNDNTLNITNLFLKNKKYFITIKKDNIDTKKQIQEFILNNYNKSIEDNIHYFKMINNTQLFIIILNNKNELENIKNNDYESNDKYSWCSFFNLQINNSGNIYKNINYDVDYNPHINNKLYTDLNIKHKILLKDVYSFLQKV
jgi:hypothetical protein